MIGKAENGLDISMKKATTVDFDEQLLCHIRCSRNNEAKSMITRDLAKASDGFGTLLHYAATHGNATIVRYLIKLDCEIDFPGRDGKTPLMLAVTGEFRAAMKALLSADADIVAVDDGGQSALQMAFGRDCINAEIVELFVYELQIKTRTFEELAERIIAAGGNMFHAATSGDVRLLECLRVRGVDVNSRGPNGATGLHAAAELGRHRVASWLIENGADVNALDNRGNSALHVSANNGSKDAMTILLERGADFNLTGRRDGCTPVDVATKKVEFGEQFVECLKLLRKHGAKTTSEEVPFSFDERLLSHIRVGHCLARWQLNETLVEARDDEGTLLHHAAKHDNARAAKLLIELGSNVDLFVAGRTPLMLAAQEGCAATLEVLLQANANIDLTDDEGRSAVAMALGRYFFGRVTRAFIRKWLANNRTMEEIAEILISAGANMYHAADSRNVELMECMLERGIDVDSRGHFDKTGLHLASGRDDANSAEWLIYHGADTNALDENGYSPLYIAASIRDKNMMRILLERGANPNLRDRREDCTPLFALLYRKKLKFKREDVECVELLLRYGAVPSNSIRIPGTVLDHALDRSNDEAIRMLISHLAMLEMRGVSIAKSAMRCEERRHRSKVSELETFHGTCLRILETPVSGKITLSDLLNGSEGRLQLWARNEKFVPEVRKVCFELKLGESNSYYHRRAMERIDKASRVVILKNEAVRVVCKLFNGNFDECYIFARNVVDYLDVPGLENLVEMAKMFRT